MSGVDVLKVLNSVARGCAEEASDYGVDDYMHMLWLADANELDDARVAIAELIATASAFAGCSCGPTECCYSQCSRLTAALKAVQP